MWRRKEKVEYEESLVTGKKLARVENKPHPLPNYIVTISQPDAWLKFGEDKGIFYVDPLMVRQIDGEPLKGVSFYRGYLILQSLGLRNLTDTEYNVVISENAQVAEQMRRFLIRTGFLKKVERTKDGYTAMYIAIPKVERIGEGFEITGSEKRINLPPQGWFKVSQLLESETGLPQITYEKIPCERCAYFWIREGDQRPILRGSWSWSPGTDRQFDIHANWERPYSDIHVGIRAASNEKPRLRLPSMSYI